MIVVGKTRVLEVSADPRKSNPLGPSNGARICALWTNFAQPKQRSTSFKSCTHPASFKLGEGGLARHKVAVKEN